MLVAARATTPLLLLRMTTSSSSAPAPFAATTAALDGMIRGLEDELGSAPAAGNPDDPWQHSGGRAAGIERAPCPNCSYVLTRPFERRCPSCMFSGANKVGPSITLRPRVFQKRPEPAQAKAKAAEATASGDGGGGGGGDAAAGSAGDGAAGKKKKKKEKKEKAKAAGGGGDAVAAAAPEIVDWNKVHLQVSRLTEITVHPESEKLLKGLVDVGGDAPRHLCAGLQAHYRPEQLQGRLVVTVTNMKPARLGGELSEVMLLAADVEGRDVTVLEPPAGSAVGDRVYLEGGEPSAVTAKQLSSKIWARVVSGFKVAGGAARYHGTPVVTAHGTVTAPGVPDGAGIH